MSDAVETPRRRRFAVPGGSMAAVEWGAPVRPLDVLFLHANGFNGLTYRRALAPLGEAGRVMAVDMRGHGLTDLPTQVTGHRWRIFAEDLLALLAALGGMPRILAGHSMGGTAALLASAALGEASPRLVLFDPVIFPADAYGETNAPEWDFPLAVAAAKRRAVFANRDEAFAQYQGRGAFRTWPDAILRDYLEDGLRDDGAGAMTLSCVPAWEAANFAHALMTDPYAALRDTRVSMQVFKAEFGSTCRAKIGETVPGTTHFLPMEQTAFITKSLASP